MTRDTLYLSLCSLKTCLSSRDLFKHQCIVPLLANMHIFNRTTGDIEEEAA
uniref:Uncharacterized protein n=1 Tax=Anguilla anguilla TaxID=7936 RepID=A0A0E9V3S1_ANGAN